MFLITYAQLIALNFCHILLSRLGGTLADLRYWKKKIIYSDVHISMPPPLQTFKIFAINWGLDRKFGYETSKWQALEFKGFKLDVLIFPFIWIFSASKFRSLTMQPLLTSATSEGAQGIFSKNTFLKSEFSNENDEICHIFEVEIFTKTLLKRGVLRLLKIEITKFGW